jgi:hypothetical protein
MIIREGSSVLENIRNRNLLIKVAAGAGLLALVSACGTETADTVAKPSVSSTQEAPSQLPSPSVSETETTTADIQDAEVLQITGITTVSEAEDYISEYNKLFEGILDPKTLKDAANAYTDAVNGNPKKYIKLYSVDKEEFLILLDAQKSFLKGITDIQIPDAEADAYAELEGADFSYDTRINAAKGYLFLSQYMVEQGVLDQFPESTKTVTCSDFGDPQEQLRKYISASSVGGFFAGVTKDSVACDDTNAIYDTFAEYLPDFDQQFPNFSRFFKELKKAEQQAISQLS